VAPDGAVIVLGMVILFDVNGTLTDPAGLGEPWGRPELGLPILRAAIQTAMVDALVGEYRPFAEHVRAAIELEVRRAGLDASLVDRAAERATRLDPFSDARAALDLLRDGGHTLATLTNSGAESGQRTLEAAGLADRFDRFLGVDAVRTFKPHPATYGHAVEELGASPAEMMLVAAHGWDVNGAKRAGLRTAWISRGEQELSAMTPEPDLRAEDLLGVARQLTGG
jgi:2-haloacid dehalogenase